MATTPYFIELHEPGPDGGMWHRKPIVGIEVFKNHYGFISEPFVMDRDWSYDAGRLWFQDGEKMRPVTAGAMKLQKMKAGDTHVGRCSVAIGSAMDTQCVTLDEAVALAWMETEIRMIKTAMRARAEKLGKIEIAHEMPVINPPSRIIL